MEFMNLKSKKYLISLLGTTTLFSFKSAEKTLDSYQIRNNLGETYFRIDYSLRKEENNQPHPVKTLSTANYITQKVTLDFNQTISRPDPLQVFFNSIQPYFDNESYSKELISFYKTLGLPGQSDLSFVNGQQNFSSHLIIDNVENKFGVYLPVLYYSQSTIYTIQLTSKNAKSNDSFEIKFEIPESSFFKREYFEDLNSFAAYREENSLE